MTILSSDIRLLESERMTDTTDGGGRRTNRVIPDGVAGNIFPKVSRVDAVYGRVNLRKIYPHINTANLDVYAGAHFVITDAPDNARISVLAFSTGSDFDMRTAARDRIESYVTAGPVSRMALYGRQLKGAGAILAYQRVEEPLPEIGDVYAISTEVGGTTTAQQFVRIKDVSHEVRTFEDAISNGPFDRRVLTLQIGAPLREEFSGLSAPSRYASDSAAAAGKLRSTTVADAARYYGIQPLSAAVSSGALELSVASVYTSIVPTTQRETPVSLASAAGAGFGVDAGSVVTDPSFQIVFAVPNEGVYTARALRPIKPGSLEFLGHGFSTSTDDGFGRLTGLNYTGTVDYETGVVRVTANYGSATDVTLRYTPQATVSQSAHTKALPITLATRGTVFAVPLLPLPAPGTLVADFRALGKWYRLRDNGVGELVGGDAAYGTGTVDYVTGGVTISLGALPDVGSSVLLSWGSPAHYEVRTADAGAPYQQVQLAHFPVKKSSLTIKYTANATEYTITDNGDGALTGAASGVVDYLTGSVRITYAASHMPDFDAALAITYTSQVIDPVQPAGTVPSVAPPGDAAQAPPLQKRVDLTPGSATTISVGEAVAPGTFRISPADCEGPGGTLLVADLIANADGTVRIASGRWDLGLGSGSGQDMQLDVADRGKVVGSVNASTGVLTLSGSAGFTRLRWTDTGWSGSDIVTAPIRFRTGQTNQVFYVPAGITVDAPGGGTVVVPTNELVMIDTARSATLAVASDAPLRLDLTSTSTSATVPGSVMFNMAGKTFIDRNGTLYTDVSPTTGSGLAAGTLDYASGIATPTFWERGGAPAVTVKSLLTKFGDYTATSVSLRTAGSPLRPASLYVQVTAEDGELLAGTADPSGNITGGMTGVVEQTMGVVNVAFAKPVLPGTLRYSAVVLSNLPLNADILGLDPVRLPSDGRVPIFRPADVTVIHHTDIYNAGTPAAGSTITVGRTNLSALWLEDADKKKLAANLYAVDLAAGTATMAADLSLAGYTTPIVAKHRIEEMGLLSDVQINGQLTLAAPLLRDFPAGSLLSSALLYGDLQARVTNVFDQQTWTNVWQNTVIGTGATAQFNDADYPLEVLNDGAVTERWRLNFTTTTSFQVIGENLGVIGTGTTGTDLQPINGLTSKPYFTLRAAGWGLGWAVGNQLRFDTIAAAPPTWLARCVLPGAALTGDSFDAQLRGDVD